MRRESIFFTLTISFVISILLVIISLTIILNNGQIHQERHLQKKYFPVVKMFVRKVRHEGITAELIKDLEVMNMEIVKDKGTITALTYNPKTEVLIERKSNMFFTRVLNLKNTNYVYIQNKNNVFLLKDNNTLETDKRDVVFLVFAIILITLIISFLTTIRKLYPLKILKDKVTTLGDENFDFECCDTAKKDEVSQLALEFKNTALKLQKLKESRNVFIRNIMHELKTPITKGRFLVELNNTEENVEKLKRVFDKLESLIGEFASIEELITASRKNLDKNYYFLEDIIDEAIDTLMIEDDVVENKTQNLKIFVHYKLFSVAIKNLIDNAIKYSSNNKATILTLNDEIIIQNEGKKLANKLETYFEPFSKDENKEDGSFGLGLYIVYNILKANGYKLEYEYIDGINNFKCVKECENS